MQPGTVIDDRFEIVALAGTGGMGAVYKARDRHASVDVAVKILSHATLDDARRFDREARILAGIEHPSVVRYVTHGATLDGQPFLVLEWLDGEDLAAHLREGPLGVGAALELARLLARALGVAHARGIVHRDVKPANVFLVGRDPSRAKLLDFGIAYLSNATHAMTRSGTAIGTPAYMAPEQARGVTGVDARADVFSLGCVLFECITGRPPFVGEHVVAILAKVLFEDAPRLASIVPGVPPELDALVDRMLSKTTNERPADANEVVRALDAMRAPDGSAIARATSHTERPLAITSGEQRLLAVVVTSKEAVQRLNQDEATMATEAARGPEEIGRLVASLGARYSPLADGSAVAVLGTTGSATDLALRVARCALGIRALRPRLPISVAIGRGDATRRIPVGEVIDRAVALMPTPGADASPRIRVDDLTAGLLGERFEISGDERGLFLDAEREATFEPRRLLGKPMPCVGRARELGVLEATLGEVIDEGVARGALLLARAGLGKSRVVSELVRRAAAQHPELDIWLGRGDAMASGAVLGILASALRRAAGIADGEPIAVRRRKWAARVARHLEGAEALRATEFLGEVVGASMSDGASVQLRAARNDPSLMGDQLARAFEELMLAETAARPVLLVLEDFHWGDGGTLRLVEGAMRACRERPFFVLVAGRPETVTSFPAFATMRGFTQIVLGELGKRAAEQLVQEALGDAIEPALREEIVTRAGGHPFYLEELVRYSAGGAGRGLPETILAMLQARVEGLAPEPRRLLRAASVFGDVFWSGGVARLLGSGARTTVDAHDWLPILLAEELVERRASSRFSGEDEYVFRHALLRDAAYAMLTDADRATGHRLAVAWLETAGERDPIALAEHWARANQPGPAASAFLHAALQALEGHDVAAALRHAQRARAVGGALAPVGELALVEAEAQRWLGNFAEAETLATAAAAALPRGTAPWFRAMSELIGAAGRRGEYDTAIDWATTLGEAAPPEARDAWTMALCAAGRQLFHAGGYHVGDALIETLRAQVGAEDLDPHVAAEVHRVLGARARHFGDLAGDLTHYRDALAAYERAGDARNAVNCRVSVGFAHVELGDHATGRARFEEAMAEAGRMGLSTVATRARQNLGLVLGHEGRFEEARVALTTVIEESIAQGNVRFEGWTRIYLSRALHGLGHLALAEEEAGRAAAILELTPPARAGALAALVLALVDTGRAREASPHAREAMATLESFGGIEEFESLVWLAAVRSAIANGERGAAALHARALARLESRAAAIGEPGLRASFLENVPENAALRSIEVTAETRAPPIAPTEQVARAYDPATFADDAATVTEAIRAHLEESLRGALRVVDGAPPPDALLERFAPGFPENGSDDLRARIDAVIASSVRLHHPRYLGYQLAAPIPRAAALTALAATLNSGMAAYDGGQAATILEKRVIDWMLGLVPWERGGGLLTSGGSLGNLTALLAARQRHLGAEREDALREEGAHGLPALAILAGEHTHYSVERAAQVMGLGRRGVVAVRCDAATRLDPSAIADAVAEARSRGRTAFALVASAGSTATGAIDPLDAIADACGEHGLWLHVDGAHGASALLSETHRTALAGMERADSIVWDAHKLMQMPAVVTAVLVRDRAALYATFAQRAEYLFEDGAVDPWYDVARRTIECTKPLLSVPLWLSLTTLGTSFFGDLVDHGYALARRLAAMLVTAEDFELRTAPDTNIVCFRHRPAGATDLDAHQRAIRARLREDGDFFVVQTTLDGHVWLRCSLMSPVTTETELAQLLDAIRTAAAR